MVFARLIEHVKKQHWTGVLIEVAIVTLGVFIGLQVNNWNEARANRGIVARHLSEIAEDLRAHIASHAEILGSATSKIAAVDYVYEQAFGANLPASAKLPATVHLGSEDWPVPQTAPYPADRLDYLMGAIDSVRTPVGTRSGYDSLIASGHLGLIENKNLARAIQVCFGHLDDVLDTSNAFRIFRNEGATLLYRFGVSVFDRRPAGEIVALARNQPEFAAYLRSQRESAAIHAGLLDRQHAETVELLGKIEAELKQLQ